MIDNDFVFLPNISTHIERCSKYVLIRFRFNWDFYVINFGITTKDAVIKE